MDKPKRGRGRPPKPPEVLQHTPEGCSEVRHLCVPCYNEGKRTIVDPKEDQFASVEDVGPSNVRDRHDEDPGLETLPSTTTPVKRRRGPVCLGSSALFFLH